MSKLSFRARALDCGKQMPVYLAEELPDLSEYVTINRSVPQMPTGVEKEEEMELHLQQAITAQQASTVGADIPSNPVVIPTPKYTSDVYGYDELYPSDYRIPKQLIRIQAALNLEPEYPDYDLDSEDEQWIRATSGALNLEITPIQFEKIMDTLEKQSEYQVITADEAKLLLQEDDDIVFAVYDYWLNKRYGYTANGRRLIPRVRIDKRDGATATDPYVGFRRRAEKMQTRKNRKNDEESYEKILKLRHDLQKAVTLLEMVKRREKSKRELIKLSLDLSQKRFDMGDTSGDVYNQLKQEVKPAFQFSREEMVGGKARKQNKKRKMREDRELVSREWLLENAEQWHKPALFPSTSARVEHERVAVPRLEKDAEEEADGAYTFKRRRGCIYHAPIDEKNNELAARCWPWEESKTQFPYVHAYLKSRVSSNSSGLRYVGLIRRRVGRGGRILFDRVSNSRDLPQPLSTEEDLPSTSSENVVHRHPSLNQKEIPYFVPPNFTDLNDSKEFASDDVSTNSAAAWRFDGGSSLSSSSSLDLLNANELPLATLSGPNGNLDVRLKIGVTPSFYAFQRDRLSRNVIAQQQQLGRGGQVDLTSSSVAGSSSSANALATTSSKSYVNYENGRLPYVYTSPDNFLVLLDSGKAFEAIAAVMNAKQVQQLADRYQKNSPNNNNNSNNFNLSNSTNSIGGGGGNNPTTTNGETNQTSRLSIPSPSPAVERVLSQTAVLLPTNSRCSKKVEKLEKLLLVEQDLMIRKNLPFLSS